MELDLQEFAENKGIEIASKILKNYDESDIEADPNVVEVEIYKRSLHESVGFFLEHGNINFDKELEKLRFYLEIKTGLSKRKINTINHEELLGNIIKFEALDSLSDKGIVIL
jgi:hypothetical protein